MVLTAVQIQADLREVIAPPEVHDRLAAPCPEGVAHEVGQCPEAAADHVVVEDPAVAVDEDVDNIAQQS
jgi:hypothetical protein